MDAAVRYLENLGRKVGGDKDGKSTRRAALERAFEAIQNYEESLTREMLRVLQDCGATVYGISDANRISERMPTISFNVPNISPATLTEELARENIGVRDGRMYSPRLMKRLGLAKDSGAVRASLVHYNTIEEVHRFGVALAGMRA